MLNDRLLISIFAVFSVARFSLFSGRIEGDDHERLNEHPGIVLGNNVNSPLPERKEIWMSDRDRSTISEPNIERLEGFSVQCFADNLNIH